jgi:repressor LexA
MFLPTASGREERGAAEGSEENQGQAPILTFLNLAYTERQGQFLAYIHQYSIVNGCAPAEAGMQRFFQITPPSVHSTKNKQGLFLEQTRGEGVALGITVRFSSYIWKRIDGFILDSLKEELARERAK